MIGEQERRHCYAHVVLDIVCQHAQEHMRFHARGEPVMDGAHLHIHTLQRPERPLNEREALVSRYSLHRPYRLRWKTGSHNVNTIEAGLGSDLVLEPPEGEPAVGDFERKVLLYLMLVDDRADCEPDRSCFMLARLLCNRSSDTFELTLCGLQQRLPLPCSLRGSAGLRQAMRRSPGKSGEVISARSRSSNSDICKGPWSSASAAICGALRQLIQSRPAGFSSSAMRAEVTMPRSPTIATCDSLNRRLSLSTCSRIVSGSAVSPSNTSIATGVPSVAHSNP